MLVLIFHRVLPRQDLLFPHEMHAQRFDQLCAWLSTWFQVLPLEEAIQRHRAGSLPAAAAAITFDDGYADNHHVALPILKRHGLHATFFVADGFLDGGCMWNDRVIESLRQTNHQMIDLSRPAHGGLGYFSLSSLQARRHAIDTIIRQIKHLVPDVRAARVDAVVQACGVTLPDDLMMSSEQVRALHNSGMSIGGHTVTHPILAVLDEATAKHEISSNRDRLAAITGAPVNVFAYPNGKLGADYTPAVRDWVEACGYECAVSTNVGTLRAGQDLFQIPRYTPWESSKLRVALRFAQALNTGRVRS